MSVRDVEVEDRGGGSDSAGNRRSASLTGAGKRAARNEVCRLLGYHKHTLADGSERSVRPRKYRCRSAEIIEYKSEMEV